MSNPTYKPNHPDHYTMARALFFGALCRSELDIAHAHDLSITLATDLDTGIGVNEKGEPVAPGEGVPLRVMDVQIPIDDKGNTESRQASIVVVDKKDARPVLVPAPARGDTMPLVLSTGAARLAVAFRALSERFGIDVPDRVIALALAAATPMLARGPHRLDDLRGLLARALSEAMTIVADVPMADEEDPAPDSDPPAPPLDEKAAKVAKLKAELAALEGGGNG